MEKSDALKPDEQVTVTIFGHEGSRLYQATNTGFHSLEVAIKEALANAALNVNPEDCVFEVANLDTNVAHKYRINAHGHLKLIV